MTNLHILSDPVSDFWKCPKKFFLFLFLYLFLHFLITFFDTFGLIGSITTFFKNPGCWHECRPIFGLHFVYIGFLSLIKKGFLGVQQICITSFWHFLAILAIKMADFYPCTLWEERGSTDGLFLLFLLFFLPTSKFLFLPGWKKLKFCSYPAEKKLKFCSYPAEKSSTFCFS